MLLRYIIQIFSMSRICLIAKPAQATSSASACDCDIATNATEALNNAIAVFKGEVLGIKEEMIVGKCTILLLSRYLKRGKGWMILKWWCTQIGAAANSSLKKF